MCYDEGTDLGKLQGLSKENHSQFEPYKEDGSEPVKDVGNLGGESSLTKDIFNYPCSLASKHWLQTLEL